MYIVADDASVDAIGQDDPAPIRDPRRMTAAELRRLGLPRLVYLRCGTVEGQVAYAIHAADGTAITVVDEIELAIELAAAHDMTFVPVH